MNTTEITISDSAAERIKEVSASDPTKGNSLRISVEGGGCAGFQYKYDFGATEEENDLVLSKNGSKVIIDKDSAEFMKGSIIDYVKTLGFSSFEIRNPSSSSKCGCGNSFSI